MVKISDFLIGLILVGLVGTAIFLFVGELGNQYGVSVDAGNTEFYRGTINKTTIQAQNIQNKLSNSTADTSIADRLGAFFGSGYDALVLSTSSLNIFGELINDASDKLHLPAYITVSIVAIIVILIFVSIVLAVLLKVQQ